MNEWNGLSKDTVLERNGSTYYINDIASFGNLRGETIKFNVSLYKSGGGVWYTYDEIMEKFNIKLN